MGEGPDEGDARICRPPQTFRPGAGRRGGVEPMSTPARDPAVHDLMIDVRDEEGLRRLVLSGELDLASAWNLVETVSRLCKEGVKDVALDISALEFIDSTGLRAILTTRALCAENNCGLSLAPAPEQINPQVRRLLQVTGLLERLPFAGDAARPDA